MRTKEGGVVLGFYFNGWFTWKGGPSGLGSRIMASVEPLWMFEDLKKSGFWGVGEASCFNSKVDNDCKPKILTACFWKMMIARLPSRVSCQALGVWGTLIGCQRCFRLFSFTWHWLPFLESGRDESELSLKRNINTERQGLYYPVILWILRGLYQGTSWKISCDRFFVSLSQKSEIHIVLMMIREILHHLGCIKPGT